MGNEFDSQPLNPKEIRKRLVVAMHVLRFYDNERNNYERNFKAPSESHKWLWRGFPPSIRVLKVYLIFTDIWILYSIIRTLFRHHIEHLISYLFEPSLPAHCFLHGRFHFQEVTSEPMGLSLCILLTIWTLFQRYIRRGSFFHSWMFLMQDERDAKRYADELRLFGLQNINQEHEPHSSSVRIDSDSSEVRLEDKLHERFLRKIFAISYKSPTNANEYFLRLRSNRSPEAHRKLIKIVSLSLKAGVYQTGNDASEVPIGECYQQISVCCMHHMN